MKNILFQDIKDESFASSDACTFAGITKKTLFLLLITILVGAYASYQFYNITDFSRLIGFLIGASIVGFICVFVGRINPTAAKICSIIYAVCEGAFLGIFTAIANLYVPMAGYMAVFGTLSVFSVVLFLYSTKIVTASKRLKAIFYALFISLILAMIASIFISVFYQEFNLPLAIGISVLVIVFSSIALIFKFEEATSLVNSGCDRKYEWLVSFGLIISILIIYVEILRLILIFAHRD